MPVSGGTHQFEAGQTKPLKAVRRCPGLEGPAAQDAPAEFLDACRDFVDLGFALDAARPRHHANLAASHPDAFAELDHRALGTEMAAGQVVGRGNSDDFVNALNQLDIAGIKVDPCAYGPDHRLPRAG